ncbi:MAG: hypothetical protein WBF32_04545 [Candidatus Aminicenantaceae bacterium]
MNLMTILLGLLFMLVFYFGIHLIVNRGKIKFNYLIITVLYSFMVGVPVAYFSYFPEKFNPILYIIYYAVVLLPLFSLEFYNCIRGRQSWVRFLMNFVGVMLILVSPFVEIPEKLYMIGAGLVFVTGFFIYLFRYPHLNPMWLEDAAYKAGRNVEKNCGYSSKPVIVSVPSRITSSSSIRGLYLLFKKKHAIVKISKDLHDKLGRPNMEQYTTELVKMIKEKTKVEKQISDTISKQGE